MPNFDAGHYFLTALMPVRLDSILVDGQSHSRRHLIREALFAMPAGERTAASQGKVADNPFARSTRTHFARFVVLDDVVFNGRVSGDSLIESVRKINPLKPQTVDRLSRPFLIFVADFDAASAEDSELNAYLTELWETMAVELRSVLQHCIGFDSIVSPDDFFGYIKKCQIETTMPFNDYWSTPPNLKNVSLGIYEAVGILGLLVFIVGFFTPWRGWLPWAGLLLFILDVWTAYWRIRKASETPFPTSAPPAPGSDLPTVLKALFVQRSFTKFAIANQGQSDEMLYDAFSAFIAENQPHDIAAPTQKPGVIGVEQEGGQ